MCLSGILKVIFSLRFEPARALLVPLPWGAERTALLFEAYPELIETLDREKLNDYSKLLVIDLLKSSGAKAACGFRNNLRDFLAALEKAVIQRALKITEGAQAEVARRLGMSRSDLSYKLGKHRIKAAGD